MGKENRGFLSWQISTPVAVTTWLLLEVFCMCIGWCTVRLSLIELYNNGDLNLVTKTMKKNKRRIPYTEVMFIKC
jgi:hypothetical protein